MTRIPVRIKVKCIGCRTSLHLSEEQYRELLTRSQVALSCPHCAHRFEYHSVTTRTASTPARSQRSGRSRPEVAPEPDPAPASSELPFLEAAPAAPEFPPPPFAPLRAGAIAPANAAPPPFVAMGGASPQVAGIPQGTEAPALDGTKKLSLNDRFKQLPAWVQWSAIGVTILLLAIVIFAIPTGGGKTSPESELSREREHPRTSTPNDRSSSDSSAKEKKTESGKEPPSIENKESKKATGAKKITEERQP